MDHVHFTINENNQKIATYCFAGINVEIVSAFKRIHLMCQEYVTDAEPEIRIETTAEEIE